MDWATLHAKARAALPPSGIPPKRYMVGVLLKRDVSAGEQLTEFDFLWMRAHAKIPVSTIRAQWMKRYPDIEIELECKDEVPPPDTIIKLLNYYEDDLVVFRTVAKNPEAEHTSPKILAPLDIALRSAPVAETPPLPAGNEGIPAPSWDMLRDHERLFAEPFVRRSSLQLQDPPPGERTPSAYASPHKAHAASTPNSPSRDCQTPRTMVKPEPRAPEHIKAECQSSPPPHSPEPDAIAFDVEGVFKRDPSPEVDDGTEMVSMDRFVREIIDQQPPEILEAAVAKSMKMLEALKSTFTQYTATSVDASAWIQSIEKLKAQAARTRTVVGVVGNTGAGKSSVINAMLDEERLVPTNCMRACTAVVTELSWNDSNDSSQKYRAEIEFIGRGDWEKELKILLKEFLTENGTLSRESSDQNTDAGIAWAKFHAVYPEIHKDNLDSWTVEKLMAERSVLSVLDTTKRIIKARPDAFYAELQKYVDSKEKTTGKKDKDQKKPPPSTEYWPLIKVVKIYTKSPALSTGAVIVDLPGVHDSNAARAAVADRYMKQCTGLWIVAPITRAVDDKAAKTLLGDSFKRQLKYDGNYSSVTFICSKTDDISITEATDSLELHDQIYDLEEQQDAHEKEIDDVNKQIAELKESVQVYKEVIDEADNDLETWEDLKDDAENGKTVCAPVQKKPSKRKRGGLKKKSNKRRQAEEDDYDMEYISSGSDDSKYSGENSDSESIQAPRSPLTQGDIKRKLEELRLSKKNARKEKAIASNQINELRPEIREIKEKIAGVQAKMSAICISGRNEYSKGAIQNDFAAGIKELDQENLAEEDEEAFNPEEEIRDYDEVAQSLPVFCVSSRAYQKMSGRLKKDEKVPGFTTPEETGMPQLQAHCKKLTEAGRIQACRTFLLTFCQQLTTFQLWASNDGTGLKMNDDEKRKQLKYLEARLSQLDEGLEQAVTACLSIMKKELRDQIFGRFPDLVEDAVKAAPDTARKWGAHKNAGGMHFMTYKAVCRRNGAYQSSSAGFRDFNSELIEPVIKRGASGWERAFQTRLPKALQAYTKDAGKVLTSFHDKIEERARSNGAGLASLSMLKSSIYRYEQMFQAVSIELLAAMQQTQKDANREFVPTISDIMMAAYDLCTNEHGTGSFMRMKDHMVAHVERVRHHMFTDATKKVEQHLAQMCKSLEDMMANKSDEIFAMMRADYMQVLGGVQVSHYLIPSEEESMRAEVKKILKDVDPQFEKVVNGELDEEEEEEEEESDWVHVDQPEAEADKSLQFDNDTDSIMGAQDADKDETMQDALYDTVIAAPSPGEGSDAEAEDVGPRLFRPTVEID